MSDFYEHEIEKKFHQTLNQKGIKGLTEHITNDLEKWKSVEIKVAVTGNSGTGKSSLINALRGIDQSNENAAKEGVVETTTKIACYAYPNNERIKLFDLPGVGTSSMPIKSYMQTMNFKQYDFVIVVSADRFLENDVEVIKALKSLKKTFYLVRSKVGRAVEDQRFTQTRAEVLGIIRSDCLSKLKLLGVEAKDVFLIDSHVHNDFDLGRLQSSLARDAPDAYKNALILTFRNTTKEVITTKMKVLRKRVGFVAIKATCCAVPGANYFVDLDVITDEIAFCKQQLGLDDETLGSTCAVLEVDKGKLKEIISYEFQYSKDDILKLLMDSDGKFDFKNFVFQTLLELLEKFITGFIANYTKAYTGMHEILNRLEKVSLELSDNVLDKLQGSTFL